jgi:selenocysteine-specific elongation factor
VEYCIRTAEGLAAMRDEVCRRVKMLPAMLEPIAQVLISEGLILDLGDGLLMHRQTADAASQRVVEQIGTFHQQSPESPGIPFEELGQTAGLQKAVLEAVLGLLVSQGRIVEKGRRFALAGHRGSFNEQDRRLLEAVELLFTEQLFQPPSIEEIVGKLKVTAAEATRAVRLLREHDRLVWAAEGLMFHKNAVERAKEILLAHFRDESRLESVRFKYLLDTTRKYAIPLLDHMDRIGVTMRVGNTRYLKEARNAGARPPASEG